MKPLFRIIAVALVAFFSTSISFSQLLNVAVEEIEHVGVEHPELSGYTSYRVFAQVQDANDIVVGVLGEDGLDGTGCSAYISTTTGFWNSSTIDALYGHEALPYIPELASSIFDSYVTIGYTSASSLGVSFSDPESTEGSISLESTGDQIVGVGEWVEEFVNGSSSIDLDGPAGGGWFLYPGDIGGFPVGVSNSVLLGQFTTAGVFSYDINLSIINDFLEENNFNTSQSFFHCSDDISGLSYVSESCADPEACNYDPDAEETESYCTYIGDSCNDGNSLTENDMLTDECLCVGTATSGGCTDSIFVNVFEAVGPNCFGHNDGWICASVSGEGNGPFFMSLENDTSSAIQGGLCFSNLSEGIYTIYAWEDFSCPPVESEEIFLAGPQSLNLAVETGIGIITLSASGGTPTYSYQVLDSNGNTVSTSFFTDGLSCGNYTVLVFDANGCLATTTVSLSCEEEGCMDPAASNFNENATIEDGSCSYAITFSVDLGNVNFEYTEVQLAGGFNAWFPVVNPMTEISDGIFEIVVDLQAGTHEYLFVTDLFTNMESLDQIEDSSCVFSTPEFTNRILEVTQPAVLPLVCWEECNSCYGCMDSAACNYDPEETEEGGACSYPGEPCELEGHANTSLSDDCTCEGDLLGCTEVGNPNYNPDAVVDDGSCVYPNNGETCETAELLIVDGSGVIGDNTNALDENDADEAGCWLSDGDDGDVWFSFIGTGQKVDIETFAGSNNDTQIAVYEACGGTEIACDEDDGEQFMSLIEGLCTEAGAEYFIEVEGWNGTTGDFAIEVRTAPSDAYIVYCGDPNASNYTDPSTLSQCELQDNNTCVYTECNDPEASNYDETSVSDEGCTYSVTFSVDVQNVVEEYQNINIAGDFNGWCGFCTPMLPISETTYEITLELTTGNYLYKFVADDWGGQENFDFIEDIECILISEDFSVANRLIEITENTVLPTVCWEQCTSCAGCSDPEACDFDPEETEEGGNCTYTGEACDDFQSETIEDSINENCECAGLIPGCTDDQANNYNDQAEIDDGSCCFESFLNIEISDTFGDGGASYSLLNNSEEEVSSGLFNEGTNIDFQVCVEQGCYLLSFIPDNWPNETSANVYFGTELIFSHEQFDSFDQYPILINIGDDPACIINGCTDSTACNYFGLATEDDGTCEYETCVGCGQAGAANYSELVTIEDGSCYWEISGVVFIDDNLNGVFDPFEQAIPYQSVYVDPISTLLISDDNGRFGISELGEGDFTLTVNYTGEWTNFTTPITQSITFPNFGGGTVYFGVTNEDVPAPSACVDFYSWGFGVPCNDVLGYNICYRNMSPYPISGVVEIELDPLLSYDSSFPSDVTLDGQTISWEFDNLGSWVMNFDDIFVTTPDETHIGEWMTNVVTIYAEYDGELIPITTQTIEQEVTCAYDPNDIQGFPFGYTDEHWVLPDTRMEYLIRFQNTGNAPAGTVLVVDTLDQDMDWESFELIANSHSVMTTIDQTSGRVEFLFENINLPDSTANEPESHGLVSFKIDFAEGTSIGEEINQTAYIFFDNNPPVITNTTWHTLHECGGEASFESSATAICAGEELTFTSSYGNVEDYEWKLDGELVSTAADHTLTLESGDYFLSLDASNPICAEYDYVEFTVYEIPEAEITEDGAILTATYEEGSSYQWLQNGEEIDGATGQTLEIQEDGTYSVVITNANQCSSTSSEVVVVNVAEWSKPTAILYPNPMSSESYLEFEQNSEREITLVDAQGKEVRKWVNVLDKRITLKKESLAPGNYTIQIIDKENTISSLKLIVN